MERADQLSSYISGENTKELNKNKLAKVKLNFKRIDLN